MKNQIFYKKTKHGHIFWNEANKKCDYSHENFTSFKAEAMMGILALSDTSLSYYGAMLPDWVTRYVDKFEGAEERFPFEESDDQYDDYATEEDDENPEED